MTDSLGLLLPFLKSYGGGEGGGGREAKQNQTLFMGCIFMDNSHNRKLVHPAMLPRPAKRGTGTPPHEGGACAVRLQVLKSKGRKAVQWKEPTFLAAGLGSQFEGEAWAEAALGRTNSKQVNIHI